MRIIGFFIKSLLQTILKKQIKPAYTKNTAVKQNLAAVSFLITPILYDSVFSFSITNSFIVMPCGLYATLI